MGSGPERPGPRGFRPPVRPKAYVPDTPPPPTAGLQLRRGYNASRHPSKRFRFPKRPKAYEVYGGGAGIVSGIGSAGAATLILGLEPGTQVTLSWSTDIVRSYNGLEMRSSPLSQPRLHVQGVGFFVDASSRDARGALMRAAATGSTFLLAASYEELVTTANATSTTLPVLTVTSTSGCDWALPGQRAAIVGDDGTTALVVVQAVTSTTISVVTVDKSGTPTYTQLGTTGLAGARIMPLIQVLLDPNQGFTRYPYAVDLWTIHAFAAMFGWAGQDSWGIGASIYTYTNAGPFAASRVTDADLLVWDRPNLLTDTADDALVAGSEALDLGALPSGFGDFTVPTWTRPLRYTSSDPNEWQWLKAFLRLCRGRQRAFLLSTNRPDLLWIANVSGGIKVQSSSVAGAGDYASWWTSAAHRRLAITTSDGAISYVTVLNAPTDNGDGTLTLPLDSIPSLSVTQISIAEQVRFDNNDSDDIAITWDGGTFAIDAVVRATQDIIVPPPSFLFDTVYSQLYAYGPPPPPVPTDQEFAFVLGQNTLLYWTSDRSLTFGGISVPGGAVDGMVFCVANINNSAFSLTVAHEDTTWPAGDRIWMPNRSTTGGVERTFWFVFNASVNRWVCFKFA